MTEHGPGAERRAAGTLESEVLGILRAAAGPLTPGEVRDRLSGAGAGQRELAYSTVVTTMSRLHAKGLLSRLAGRARFLLRAGGRGQPGRGPDEPRAGQRLGPGRGAQPVRVRAVRAGRRAAAPAAGRHPGRDVAAVGPLLLPLIIPLLASAAARPLAHRLEPRQATWLLCAAAVVLAGCAAAALALAAGFAAARLPVLAALGDYSLAPFSTHDPVPVAGGIGAALALAGAAAAVRPGPGTGSARCSCPTGGRPG